VLAILCENFHALPSVLLAEDCPRLFHVWRKLQGYQLNQVRNERLFLIAISPLYQTAMSEKGAKSQQDYSQKLVRSIRDPEEVRIEDEFYSKMTEQKLKNQYGIDITKKS
jgi:hypothetical protein